MWPELPFAALGRGAKERVHTLEQLIRHALVLALEPELETVHLALSGGLIHNARTADLIRRVDSLADHPEGEGLPEIVLRMGGSEPRRSECAVRVHARVERAVCAYHRLARKRSVRVAWW